LSAEDQSVLEKLREGQSKMAKLTYAEEVRTLIGKIFNIHKNLRFLSCDFFIIGIEFDGLRNKYKIRKK
jgi:hypothetical protein